MSIQDDIRIHMGIATGLLDIISGTIRVRGERRAAGEPIYGEGAGDFISDPIDDIQQPYVLAAMLKKGDYPGFIAGIREILNEYEEYTK
jgi:hypothetical protein